MWSAQVNQGRHFPPKLEFSLEETLNKHSIKAKSVIPDKPVQTVQAHVGQLFMPIYLSLFFQKKAHYAAQNLPHSPISHLILLVSVHVTVLL